METPFKAALIETIPVLFGYVPMGFAFGLLFVKAGAAWYIPPLMSMLVFAGAAQFIAVTIIAADGTLLSIIVSTLLVNLRHMFYGISFVGTFPKKFFNKNYMIFGLTDEAYSILTAIKHKTDDQTLWFWIIAISHGYWIIGSLLGALLANSLRWDLSFLKFALTALFVVLTIEQAHKLKTYLPFVIAIISMMVGLFCLPGQMLLVSMTMTTLLLLGLLALETRG
jgi:4-azaleucine resistance transporter AzlC